MGRILLLAGVMLLPGVAHASGGQPDTEYAATGKVPLEGTLTTSLETPRPGDVFFVYLNESSLVDATELSLQILVPDRAEVVGSAPLTRTVSDLAAGESASLAVPVRALRPGELFFRSDAVLRRPGHHPEGRSFVHKLYPAPPTGRAPRPGRTIDDRPLVIYPGTPDAR